MQVTKVQHSRERKERAQGQCHIGQEEWELKILNSKPIEPINQNYTSQFHVVHNLFIQTIRKIKSILPDHKLNQSHPINHKTKPRTTKPAIKDFGLVVKPNFPLKPD